MRSTFLFLVTAAGFVGAAAVPLACNPPVYPDVAFRCAPNGGLPNCPDGYQCCSDDPAATTGGVPGYTGRAPGDVPLFSGFNNALSSTGMCVEQGILPPGAGLVDAGAEGCPVPCNPSWGSNDVASVCGVGTICCQTVELNDRDCVLQDDCWRPAKGDDIFSVDVEGSWGMGPDPWTPSSHATHQDPGGLSCAAFAQGDPDAEADCFRQLNVADQRGFCLAVSPTVQFCPLAQPGYMDACERRNLQEGRSCG
jgi:hypothetical protein